MRGASDRLSVRQLLRCTPADDKPMAVSGVEELLARLCARARWAEHVRRLGSGEGPPPLEERE